VSQLTGLDGEAVIGKNYDIAVDDDLSQCGTAEGVHFQPEA